MHDKMPGQRTQAEADKYNNLKLATPTIAFDPVTSEAVDNMRDIDDKIDYLYRYLVDIYLSFSQGSKRINLKYRDETLTENEIIIIRSVIENDSRYIMLDPSLISPLSSLIKYSDKKELLEVNDDRFQ